MNWTFWWQKRSAHDPAPAPVFLDRRTAYTCLNTTCRAIQQHAPQGRCQRCGSVNIICVDQLLHIARHLIHMKLRAAATREAKTLPRAVDMRAAVEQQPGTLTEFRKP